MTSPNVPAREATAPAALSIRTHAAITVSCTRVGGLLLMGWLILAFLGKGYGWALPGWLLHPAWPVAGVVLLAGGFAIVLLGRVRSPCCPPARARADWIAALWHGALHYRCAACQQEHRLRIRLPHLGKREDT
ncbi:MAG: hypothetical protein IPK26_03980 [Planctomycetes bacterium]|nr:hypothetical protein [Planctomycetota bacterium]